MANKGVKTYMRSMVQLSIPLDEAVSERSRELGVSKSRVIAWCVAKAFPEVNSSEAVDLRDVGLVIGREVI